MNQRIRNCAAATGLLLTVMTAGAADYTAILTGPKESPSNSSTGTGAAFVKFDATTHILEVDVAFGGLLGPTTASHIHCCTAMPGAGTAGIATETPTFGGFPLGVTSGAYANTFDTSLAASWNPAFISSHGGTTAGAESAFAAGLASGEAYLNIHTSRYPGGEIRGFLTGPTPPVPEPAMFGMLGLGVPAVLLMARRRRKA
ncbi:MULTISPECIES: CHRD domain-containing protein [unclassified Duganella]|uniref:CHRD domain-containing protein n=1 Tax=unclassified Duganella TaxID=2636909 RepID=UPI000E34FA7C|nr:MULTISPECIES: CHRD domain-containing protein [unclassified Duganella]RFP18579.1 CHRD domain-containing protein [Duganella sp. BJB475]RFP35244.1 CHRD domain-containing protein [Duganella sp. BJB476]